MGSRETLTDIRLDIYCDLPPQFSLYPLSNLCAISLSWYLPKFQPEIAADVAGLLGRCPNLSSLELSNVRIVFRQQVEDPENFAEFLEGWTLLEKPLKLQRLIARGIIVRSDDFLLHLPHFRHLEELAIELDPNPSSPFELGKIFDILRREEIQLRRISISTLQCPQIINYISSYSGLEGFSLNSYDVCDDTPSLIHECFFALKRHYASLRSLKLDMDRISAWQDALRTHLSESAESLRSLEVLNHRVHLGVQDVRANHTEPLVCVLSIHSFYQLTNNSFHCLTLQHGFPHCDDLYAVQSILRPVISTCRYTSTCP